MLRFAKHAILNRALKLMMDQQDIPVEQTLHYPTENRHKNHSKSTTPVRCMGDFGKFLADPPLEISLGRENDNTTCIAFSIQDMEATLHTCRLTGFLVAWTCQTNADGFLVGCIGPRFIPCFSLWAPRKRNLTRVS